MNFSSGQLLFQATDYWSCKYDIANRTETDNEDFCFQNKEFERQR